MPDKSPIVRVADVPAVDCPCGQARRAFADEPGAVASMHMVEITGTAQTHYHKRLTEMYYVLEGTGQMELDGKLHAIVPGDAVMIRPGVRHRAIPDAGTMLKVLNVPVPAFDPEDEWFDE